MYLQPGANALETAKQVQDVLEHVRAKLPSGVNLSLAFDTTVFVEHSIQEVLITFLEALVLVVLVMFIFLQNVRATIIPLLAIPVSIIGTFAGLYLIGFSINLLTLFGLILAIGIVVDDAIIVIENVERIMEEQHVDADTAVKRAMEEVSGPLVAIVLVSLCGVLTGYLYGRFNWGDVPPVCGCNFCLRYSVGSRGVNPDTGAVLNAVKKQGARACKHGLSGWI